MDFIADNWWVWLLGLLVVLSIVLYRSITNVFGMANDTLELAAKLRLAAETPSDERSRQLTNLGVEIVRAKLKKRALRMVVNACLLCVGGVFGVLLVAAIVVNVRN